MLMTECNSTVDNTFGNIDISYVNSAVFKQTLIPSFVYILLLTVIGIPGNALVCYVYQFKIRNKQLSANIFILALSWFDLINCVISLPIELQYLLNFIQFDEPVLCACARFITFFCNNASSIILLSIAIDRLVAFLSGPVRRRLKPYMARGIVLLAVCISGGISWPMLIFFGTYEFPVGFGLKGHTCSIKPSYLKSTSIVTFTITLLSLHVVFDLSFFIIYSIIGKRIYYDIGLISQRSMENERVNSAVVEIRKQSNSSLNENVFLTQGTKTCSKQGSACEIHLKSITKGNKTETKLLPPISPSTEVTAISDDGCSKINQSTHDLSDSKHLIGSLRVQRSSPSPSECKLFNRRTNANKTSFMLFIVTMAYVLSFLPYCVIVVVRQVSKVTFYEDMSTTEKALYQLFLRSYCLSSAINPIIYSFINASFRSKCRQALCDLICCFKNVKK